MPDHSSKVSAEDLRKALEEAAERRKTAEEAAAKSAESGGPTGEEPTRFGDWERKGIAYDF